MLTVGLPNTLILALCSAVLGTLLGHGAGRLRAVPVALAALAGAGLHRRLPRAARRGRPSCSSGSGWRRSACWSGGPNPYPLGILALSLIAVGVHRRDLPLGHPERGVGPARGGPRAGLLPVRPAMRLVVIPQGVRRVLPALVNQLIALIKESRLVYFLGPARQPAGAVPDRSGPGREHRQRVRAAAGRPLLPGHHRAADPRRQRRRRPAAHRPTAPTAPRTTPTT